MTIYLCSVCGHIEFSEPYSPCEVCLAPPEKFTHNDQLFEESVEKSQEAAVKHIPAVTVNKQCSFIPEHPCTDVAVRIGATLHPMESGHYIQFIECYVDERFVSRIYMTPGVFAAGCFHLKAGGSKVTVVGNCNLHGYWKTEEAL